jgi:hypothetical protein
MSITGNLSFYSLAVHPDPKRLLRQLIEWTGRDARSPDELPFGLSRSIGPERGWEVTQTAARDEDYPLFDELYESLYERSLDRIPDLYRDGTSLSVDLSVCPQGARISDAIRDGIPESIHNNFAPGDIFLRVGHHDIVDVSESDGRLIARPFSEVSLFGYSCPNHWANMRDMTAALPEVIAVRKELSTIMGPVEMCMLWDV